jgi:hypothetical protein
LAQSRLDEINNPQQAVSTDAVAAYNKGVEDYKKADFAQAKIDFTKAQELGFHGSLTQASPADYLRRLDQNSAAADQKTQDTLAQAREAYESGREEFRSGNYDAARKDFALARDKGFAPSFTEGLTPTEYLSRIDELQTAKAQDTSGNKVLVTGSSSGTGQTVNLADDTTGQPAPAAPDAQQAQQMDKLAASQNSFQAQGLVDMGAKAEAAGTDTEALKDYQQAHDLDPTNTKATEGVNRLSAKLGLTPTNNPTNSLTDRADQIKLEIHAINLKFNQALADTRSDISKKDFATARNDIANAQTARD